MVDDLRQKSLADVRMATEQLDAIAEAVDELWQAHIGDERLFARGSPAAADAALRGYDRLVDDIVGFSNLQIAGALDHAASLVAWGQAAVAGEETPVWAPWSVSRSLVELCAASHWLTRVPLSTQTRAGRFLSVHKRDSLSMIAIGLDESDRVQEADNDAARLGLQTITDRRGRFRGFGEEIPSFSKQVSQITPDLEQFRIYSMLSAASHGEPWAISALGYSTDPGSDSTGYTFVARKRPPAFGLWLPLTLAATALDRGAQSGAYYRGWMLS